MSSLFTKPTAQERTLKVLVYGPTKTGKSHFVHTATEAGPVLWQDTEHGSDFYDPDENHGFRVLYSKDPEKAIAAVKEGDTIATNGNRPVVALDSFSSTWFMQQEVAEELTAKWSRGKDKGRASFRAWGPAKKPLKKFYDAIMLSKCHVILTARAKMKYEVSGGGEPKEVGLAPDVERNILYAVDIILETGIDELPKGQAPTSENFYALVVGSRNPALPIGTELRDPKFLDLMGAAKEGDTLKEIEETTGEQVAAATIQTWEQLGAWIKTQGRDAEEAKAILREKHGKVKADDIPDYYITLKAHYEDNPLPDPEDLLGGGEDGVPFDDGAASDIPF